MLRAVLFAIPFLCAPVFAQFESADVLGTIRDPQGATVAKVSVTLTNAATGLQSKTTTDDGGNYTFTNVKVGRYSLVAEASGFAKAVANAVDVNVNARQRVDFTLQ